MRLSKYILANLEEILAEWEAFASIEPDQLVNGGIVNLGRAVHPESNDGGPKGTEL